MLLLAVFLDQDQQGPQLFIYAKLQVVVSDLYIEVVCVTISLPTMGCLMNMNQVFQFRVMNCNLLDEKNAVFSPGAFRGGQDMNLSNKSMLSNFLLIYQEDKVLHCK